MKTFKQYLEEEAEKKVRKKTKETTPGFFEVGLDAALKEPDPDEADYKFRKVMSQNVFAVNGKRLDTSAKFRLYKKWHKNTSGEEMEPPKGPENPGTQKHASDNFYVLHAKTHGRKLYEAKVPDRMTRKNPKAKGVQEHEREDGSRFSHMKNPEATTYPKSIKGYDVEQGDNIWDLHKSRVTGVIAGKDFHVYDPHSAKSHGEALGIMGVNPKSVKHHFEIRKNRKGEVTVFRQANAGESEKERHAAETELANHPHLTAHLGTKFNVKTE